MSQLTPVRKKITELEAELIHLRRDLHQHPELGFQEVRTSKIVENFLEKLGIPTKRYAKTGIVGVLKMGKPGKTIALRADMDALPLQEETDHEYKSVNPGCMHACGHDCHTSILLITSKILSQMKDQLSGTILLVFQPAEEGLAGAKVMLEEGCFDGIQPEAIFGQHVWSQSELGNFEISPGYIMASVDDFNLEIIGKGGHGAAPHKTVDSILVTTQIINAVQNIISRNLDPFDPGVITFGTIHGGSNFNIIAQTTKLTGTIRSMGNEVRNLLKSRFEQVVKNTCEAYNAKYKLEFHGHYPAVYNDLKATQYVEKIGKDLFGAENTHSFSTMGGEDFAFYAQKTPGCFYFIGAGNKDLDLNYPHHHPKFNIDERALKYGVEMFVRIAENYPSS